jgi:hypothetical protein
VPLDPDASPGVSPELDEPDAPLPGKSPVPEEPLHAQRAAIPSAKPRGERLIMRAIASAARRFAILGVLGSARTVSM